MKEVAKNKFKISANKLKLADRVEDSVEKEKLLVINSFSFSFHVSKHFSSPGCQTTGSL